MKTPQWASRIVNEAAQRQARFPRTEMIDDYGRRAGPKTPGLSFGKLPGETRAQAADRQKLIASDERWFASNLTLTAEALADESLSPTGRVTLAGLSTLGDVLLKAPTRSVRAGARDVAAAYHELRDSFQSSAK